MAPTRGQLYYVIDQMDHWLLVLRGIQQASTAEELRAATRLWLNRRQSFRSSGVSAADAVRNTRDAMKRWCERRGRDDDESSAIISDAAQCAVDLAVHCPLSAFHYSQSPRKHEARWQGQTDLCRRAHDAFMALQRLADQLGDHWERDASVPAGSGRMTLSTSVPGGQPAPNSLPPNTETVGNRATGSPPEASGPASTTGTERRHAHSVGDLVRFRCALVDTTYARSLLAGYVWVRLDITLRRTHGRSLPMSYSDGPDLPRSFAEACEWLRSALTRLAAFAEVSPEFQWLRCGDLAWSLGGPLPDLEGWLTEVATLDADSWEAQVLRPFRAGSEAAFAQIDEYQCQFERAQEEYIAASDCPAEVRLQLTGALQELRSWQQSRQAAQESDRQRIQSELNAANTAMGSIQNQSAEEATWRRADRLLALGLEISAQGWQDWLRATAEGDPLTRDFAEVMLKGDPEPLARAVKQLPAATAGLERLREWLKLVAKDWPAVYEQGLLRRELSRDLPAKAVPAMRGGNQATRNAPERRAEGSPHGREASPTEPKSSQASSLASDEMRLIDVLGLEKQDEERRLTALRRNARRGLGALSGAAILYDETYMVDEHGNERTTDEVVPVMLARWVRFADALRRVKLIRPGAPEAWLRDYQGATDNNRRAALLLLTCVIARDEQRLRRRLAEFWELPGVGRLGIANAMTFVCGDLLHALLPEPSQGVPSVGAPPADPPRPRTSELEPAPGESDDGVGNGERPAEDRVAEFVANRANATLEEVRTALGLTPAKIRRTRSWKDHEERLLDQFLRTHPTATAEEAGGAFGVSDEKVVGMAAWKAHRARSRAAAPPRANERPLSAATLELRADERATDPLEQVDIRDQILRVVIEGLAPAERASLNKLTRAAQNRLVDHLLTSIDPERLQAPDDRAAFEIVLEVARSWLEQEEQAQRDNRRRDRC